MSESHPTLLVGMTRSAFLIVGGIERDDWNVKGPFCDTWPINHPVGDPETGTL